MDQEGLVEARRREAGASRQLRSADGADHLRQPDLRAVRALGRGGQHRRPDPVVREGALMPRVGREYMSFHGGGSNAFKELWANSHALHHPRLDAETEVLEQSTQCFAIDEIYGPARRRVMLRVVPRACSGHS